MSVTHLDTKGLKCPLPVLRARKAMKSLAAGDLLEVESTDPSSVQDFQSFCETTGDELVAWHETAGVYSFQIRKAG
jgi:tRNA 2-thiouridine synthesizing protein A